MSIVDELKQKQRFYDRKNKTKLIAAICAAAVLILGIYAVGTICDVTGVNIKQSITVDIPKGSGLAATVKSLGKAKAVKHTLIFRVMAKGASVQPGELVVEPGMSYGEIIALMEKPNRDTNKVVIPEGYEVRQIVDAFADAGVDREEMISAVNSREYDFDFIKEIPERENPLEGYLFPDTYHITQSDSAHDIVNMMLAEFDKHYDKAFRAQMQFHGMTMDEIVTLASIIERETDAEDERGKVAGVFYNRLEKNMRLQSCATVQYILKERKANLSVEDTKIDSPYNTYQNAGLPIGPIASPGEECLLAALYPEQTDALYFVMGKDGKHIFSKTYEEHLAAKKEAGL